MKLKHSTEPASNYVEVVDSNEDAWDDHFRLHKYSPLLLKMLMSCCVSFRPQELYGQGWDAPAALEARQWLVDNGFIFSNYKPTPRGIRWLTKICSVEP